MRPPKLFSWLLICGTLAFVMTTAAFAQSGRSPGRIVAAKVTGSVTAISTVDKSQRQLATNDIVSQETQIVTAASSSVILVFSNGASLNVGADSSLEIEEFLQDPFTDGVAVAGLTQEPTTSTTKLNLTRGEVVGNVKKLNQAGGSTFTVNTPVGAAGIRGTTFRITFRPDASGRAFFTLSTAEGNVLFEGTAAEGVSVETGKEVAVEVNVTVDPGTGTVTVDAPPTIVGAQDIPSETQAIIAASAQEIVESAATVIISSVSSTTSTSSQEPSGEEKDSEEKGPEGEGEGEGEPQAQEGPDSEPTNVFGPTQPNSQTTPGDGQTK